MHQKQSNSYLTCGQYWLEDHCDEDDNLHQPVHNSQSKFHPLCTFPILGRKKNDVNILTPQISNQNIFSMILGK